jgi:hypothetical protein
MLSKTGKPVTTYSAAGINGKSSSKAFTKQDIEKRFHVTGICPQK